MDNDYYKGNNGMEVIDFIEAFDLNFNLGNVVKYIARAGKKEGETRYKALCKANDYLLREMTKEVATNAKS